MSALCVLAAVMGLVLCGSVTGMMCASAGLVLVLILSRMSSVLIFGASTVIAGLAAIVLNLNTLVPGATSPLTRLEDTTGNGSGESTLQSRLESDIFALDGIAREPFLGVGLDSASGGTFDGVTLTHNMFLLAWFQGGLMFVLALVTVILFASQQLRSVPRHFAAPTKVGLVASLISALLFSMTGPVLFERWFWLPIILALALKSAYSSARMAQNPKSGTPRDGNAAVGVNK